MPFTKTTWNEGASPGISAAQLNRIETGIDEAFTSGEYEHGFIEHSPATILNTTLNNVLTVNLTIPGHWNTYDLWGTCTFAAKGDSTSGPEHLMFETQLRLDEVDFQVQRGGMFDGEIGSESSWGGGAISAIRLGATNTGAIATRLRARELQSDVVLHDKFLYSIARRVT